jgi:hypothetical protein
MKISNSNAKKDAFRRKNIGAKIVFGNETFEQVRNFRNLGCNMCCQRDTDVVGVQLNRHEHFCATICCQTPILLMKN